jgi:hypothetical protein
MIVNGERNLCPAVEKTVVLIWIAPSHSFLFPPSKFMLPRTDGYSERAKYLFSPSVLVVGATCRASESMIQKHLHGCKRAFAVTGLSGSEAHTSTAQLG